MIRKFALGILSALILIGSVAAQTGQTWVSLGFCQLTSLSASTLISTCSGGIPAGATMAVISVSGAGIRYRGDSSGVAPTPTVGMPVAVGQAFQYSSTLPLLRIIEQSASATVDINFYR